MVDVAGPLASTTWLGETHDVLTATWKQVAWVALVRPDRVADPIADLLDDAVDQWVDEMTTEGTGCGLGCLYRECDHPKIIYHDGGSGRAGCERIFDETRDNDRCACFDKPLTLARAINRSAGA
jgi:hypothetical protein